MLAGVLRGSDGGRALSDGDHLVLRNERVPVGDVARVLLVVGVAQAAGTNVSLFSEADGTAQREALRRWHVGTVVPVAALLEAELSDKPDTTVTLAFDTYPLDMAGRAAALALDT